MKSLRFIIFNLVLLGLLSAHASTLSTKVDPTQIMPGQAFHLILNLDENAPAGLPDFSPLQYDFEIHGTAHRASYMFIDGQSKASSSWTVTLIPKRTGKITIPAIQVGHARSTPSSIEVTNTPRVSADNTSTAPATALFIKTLANESKPFINQQLIYTVKIYHNTSLLDAFYQPPQLSDAITMPLGENRQYQVIENGRPYLVEEQKYAFFPQQSGAHTLYPPSFQALIYDDIPRRVRADGQSKLLHVKPIPEPFKNKPWVPAKSLALTEHYDTHDTVFNEGTTLTRTLTLRAAGLPAELLPPLDIPKSTAYNTYAEHPVLSTEAQGNDIMGKTTVKINYLLNQAGQITLPEQTVTWYNTETKQTEHATLPKRIVHVKAHTAAEPSSLPPQTNISDIKKTERAPTKVTFKHALAVHAGLLFLLIFSSFFIFFYHANRKNTYFIKRRAFKTLRKACLRHQPQAAHDALMSWAKLTWPKNSFLNLDDVVQTVSDPAVSQQIKQLSESLYHAKQASSWNGQALFEALVRRRKAKTPNASGNTCHLPPINPQI